MMLSQDSYTIERFFYEQKSWTDWNKWNVKDAIVEKTYKESDKKVRKKIMNTKDNQGEENK